MHSQELLISSPNYDIVADLKIPDNNQSRKGIVLVHGAIINRKSLSRESQCLANYLCKSLNAYVITPDYQGETRHRNAVRFKKFGEIIDISVDFLCDEYGVKDVMGFGHSMGSYVLADAVHLNDRISHIVTYGGPTEHLIRNREKRFLNYLLGYLYSFDYKIDLRNLFQYVFDKETLRFLNDVMMRDPEFGHEHYDYNLDSDITQDALGVLSGYFEKLKDWGKPAMMMFGTNDTLVKKSRDALPDGCIDENILVKHIKHASHVTPCMDNRVHLMKLDSLLLFHRNIQKAGLINELEGFT